MTEIQSVGKLFFIEAVCSFFLWKKFIKNVKQQLKLWNFNDYLN